jgi:hypothetical protein
MGLEGRTSFGTLKISRRNPLRIKFLHPLPLLQRTNLPFSPLLRLDVEGVGGPDVADLVVRCGGVHCDAALVEELRPPGSAPGFDGFDAESLVELVGIIGSNLLGERGRRKGL